MQIKAKVQLFHYLVEKEISYQTYYRYGDFIQTIFQLLSYGILVFFFLWNPNSRECFSVPCIVCVKWGNNLYFSDSRIPISDWISIVSNYWVIHCTDAALFFD